jgi:hypothetical protein
MDPLGHRVAGLLADLDQPVVAVSNHKPANVLSPQNRKL